MPLEGGRGRNSSHYQEIVKLKPGEILMIGREEWDKKYPPTRLARKIEKKYPHQYETFRHAGGLGWVVRRVR